MLDRKDPNPEPYATFRTPREPRREQPSGTTMRATQPEQRMRARVYRSAGATIASGGAGLTISWDSESFDSNGLHDPSLNPTRITVPSVGKTSGVWQVNGVVQVLAGANPGTITVDLRRDGTTNIASYIHTFVATALFTITLSDLVSDPAPGTFFEVRCFQATGADCTLTGGSVNSFFSVIHLW